MDFFTSCLHKLLLPVGLLLLLAGCESDVSSQKEAPLPEVQVYIDADNQIYVNEERHHITRIQPLVEDLRAQHPEGIRFRIVADDKSNIMIVNELCRYIHPHPLQFASAE